MAPEKPSVMVDGPAVTTVPSQSSTSAPSTALVSFFHVAPPPLTDATLIVGEPTRTESTRACPTCDGLTASVEAPAPELCCREPTPLMVPTVGAAEMELERRPSPL